ncbi:MAG TPA: DEAD/DEAH box helicase [Xanthobacteraceae bacterium]|nr:DEAD/DEAH box helicase [Xanthobacteraceae bacterium]
MKETLLDSFSGLGLAAPIARALAEENYTTPTPIQSQAIPPVISGRDLVGIAQTGTGKTAAFALPILNHLALNRGKLERKSARVLVLSPTRELSGQIAESFKTYGRHLRLSTALAIGGVNIGRQIKALANGVDILVATPGRLLDLVNTKAFRLDRIEFFVLDEADRMLDMGFIHDITKIVKMLPAKKQSLFFSATMPKEIEHLVAQFLNEPVRVAVTPVAKTADKVEQRVIFIEKNGKNDLLAEVLKAEPIDRALVFTRTKHGADKVVKSLEKAGIASDAIHGNKSQNQRERALGAFRSGKVRVLIATDIAARGIDVDGVSHVFNFDLPNIPESYVHRIGRTARAGADGIAISFVANDERAFLRDIERLTKISIPTTDRRLNPSLGEPKGENRGGRNNGQGRKRHRRGNNPHRGQRPQPQGEAGERPLHIAEGQEPRKEQRSEPRQPRPPFNGERKHEGHRQHRSKRPHPQGERKHEQRAQQPRNHAKPEHRQHNNNGTQNQPKAVNGGQLSGVAFMNRKPKRRGGHQQPRPAQH